MSRSLRPRRRRRRRCGVRAPVLPARSLTASRARARASSSSSSARAHTHTTRSSFHYPKYVFSAAGGWFNKEPPGWERATLGAFAVMAGCAALGFTVSAARERRPTPPLWPIASQGWSAHAKEDDPLR